MLFLGVFMTTVMEPSFAGKRDRVWVVISIHASHKGCIWQKWLLVGVLCVFKVLLYTETRHSAVDCSQRGMLPVDLTRSPLWKVCVGRLIVGHFSYEKLDAEYWRKIISR
jgi:hypothetical protein